MTLISLQRFKTEHTTVVPAAHRIRALGFERRLLPGAREGGVLRCVCADGSSVFLSVAMTWDVLSQLRLTLARQGAATSDCALIRSVLSCWGVAEFERRVIAGVLLAGEGLVLDELGGPASDEPLLLVRACGLLPKDAA